MSMPRCRSSLSCLTRQTYDHRIRQAICDTRDPSLFDGCLSIPRSTAKSWIRRGRPSVVALDDGGFEVAELRVRIAELERRIRKQTKATKKLVAVIRLQRAELAGPGSGCSLKTKRLPDGSAKAQILEAVGRARVVLPLVLILRLLQLSPARYHAWRRSERECGLDDRSSCPRTTPLHLTAEEMRAMKEMVVSEDHRHMPLRALALHAQRLGRVYASASTWSKKIKERGWRRPRRRVYPAKPKTGVRASIPNEIWHADATLIRLVDGTKLFLHAVVDNFSRRILAWRLSEKLSPMSTVAILQEAAVHLEFTPTLVTDRGVENFNGAVDGLIRDGVIDRVLALVEVTFSNSIVEAYGRSLKHQWLFLNPLDSAEAVKRLVAFHVDQHNRVMPHSAFGGQTPDEIYFGTGDAIADDLEAARRSARVCRLATNRALMCHTCKPGNGAQVPRVQLRRDGS